MPKTMPLFDEEETSAHMLCDPLVAEGYAIHFVTQFMEADLI